MRGFGCLTCLAPLVVVILVVVLVIVVVVVVVVVVSEWVALVACLAWRRSLPSCLQAFGDIIYYCYTRI